MGEVRIKVGIAGITDEGAMIPARALRREALVDTGASLTIVSRAVAEDAGIKVLWRRPELVTAASGAEERVYPGMALVQVAGCVKRALVVGVSDVIAERSGAEIVLGHDYMQRARVVVSPADRTARCGVLVRRKPPPRPKPSGRR